MCVCERVLAGKLVIEVNDQRVVPPVKGEEQMKETEEAHLRRAEEGRGIHSHDPLNHQRGVNIKKSGDLRGNGDLKRRGEGYLGDVKGAGCRKSDATSRSAVSSVTSSLRS